MTMRKTVTVIVADELVYAMDPDSEYEFILLREKGRIVARPTTDYASDCRSFAKKDRQYAEPTEECRNCRFYDWDLRHSCASLLLANGVPMKQIQEWLGHSDFSTMANIYAHLDYNSKISSADAMINGLGIGK